MKIAVLPGDGIGKEIVAQALRVLRSLELPLELEEAPVGGAGYEAAGDPPPEATLALARAADAILFGAIGGPQYDALPRDKRPERGLLRLRKELGLFAHLRPAPVLQGIAEDPAYRARGLRGRAPSLEQAVLGGQGERARDHRTVEAGGDRRGQGLPRRRA